jgi:uncharacterized protein
MLRNRLYYLAKPFIPEAVRRRMRQFAVARERKRSGHLWPILPGSERPPEGWPGWPDGKRFAVVLTHDVEKQGGVDKCRELMHLELDAGFRSSFNFIPEGSYTVPAHLRDEIVAKGLEVGVHDLSHDGKLFFFRRQFADKARRINQYLKQWDAVGFRSAFMLRNLDWIHDLDIAYDASTFDTDPYEPQPEGVGTIFPFWVPGVNGAPCENRPAFGYAELPYTLPQDSTLFLHMGEENIDIWRAKLDWVARHGGMALVNVHPDYMAFGPPKTGEYPARRYQEFLQYLTRNYQGQFWHVLPRAMADFVRTHQDVLRPPRLPANNGSSRTALRKRKVWIDLENTPHIPFFKPIIRELKSRHCEIVLTARDAFQTCEMADRYGFDYTRIGRHYGQNRILKVLGLVIRSLQLLPFALRERPDLAINHGARAQILICNLLRIPTVLIMDYEHTKTPPLVRPLWEIVPSVVSEKDFHCLEKRRTLKYTGIKEDVYVPEFKLDASIVSDLQLDSGVIVVTVRPPATEAHYHNPESEILFAHFMNRMLDTPCVKAVLLPRNKRQEADIKAKWPEWFTDMKVIIPSQVVDGLNLLWHSDLVVSGGGTMNREAAALGVPVYSIFRGVIGAVDRQLQQEGRLILIESVDDVERKIVLRRRPKNLLPDARPRKALQDIVDHLETILKRECR